VSNSSVVFVLQCAGNVMQVMIGCAIVVDGEKRYKEQYRKRSFFFGGRGGGVFGYTVMSPYPRVIRSKTYIGYLKP
jgi:hypothetical protein